jgi:hypothetical protein
MVLEGANYNGVLRERRIYTRFLAHSNLAIIRQVRVVRPILATSPRQSK